MIILTFFRTREGAGARRQRGQGASRRTDRTALPATTCEVVYYWGESFMALPNINHFLLYMARPQAARRRRAGGTSSLTFAWNYEGAFYVEIFCIQLLN